MELVVTVHFKMPGSPFMSYTFLVGSQEALPQGIFSGGGGGGGVSSGLKTHKLYMQLIFTQVCFHVV
jgi:hypothetical protein